MTFPVTQLESMSDATHPWKSVLMEILAEDPSLIECIFPSGNRVYCMIRSGKEMTVDLLAIETERPSPGLRAMHTALLNRIRKHVEGHVHNLRSPLSGIRSRTELMRQYIQSAPPNDPQAVEQLFKQIERSCNRILDASDELNAQLQTFDQIFRWLDPEHEMTPMRIRSVIDELHAFYLTNLTYKRSIQLETDFPEHIPPLIIRPYMLVEPLIHIFNNAIDAMTESDDARILLEASVSTPDRIIIRIQNTGPAFSEETPFEEMLACGHSTRFNLTGTGLSFSAWLTAQAGARFQRSVNENGNVCFTMDYPQRPQ